MTHGKVNLNKIKYHISRIVYSVRLLGYLALLINLLNWRNKMATSKMKLNIITDKVFDATLKSVSKHAEDLSTAMHQAGLYCLHQCNVKNNADAGQRLIDAIGQKQDKQRIARWLVFFGKFTVKNGLLVYKKRKDITEANAEGWVERANEMPYWELILQPQLMVTFDYLAMIQSIINKASKVHELEEEGKQVTEKNQGVLKELSKIMVAYAPKDKLPEIKKTAANLANKQQELGKDEEETVPTEAIPAKEEPKRTRTARAHH